MVSINEKEIWKINQNDKIKWILVLYKISFNHFVGVPVYDFDGYGRVYIPSINKFASPEEVNDYSNSIVEKRMVLNKEMVKVKDIELKNVISITKEYLLDFINRHTKNDNNGLSYLKWCKDKLELIIKEKEEINKYSYHNFDICWIDFGYNIGNELRKLRPAILWRYSNDKEMWTVLPITSKRESDKYFYHYDLEYQKLGTVKIENLANVSVRRIKMPYYIDKKKAKISDNDKKEILNKIKNYYTNIKTDINGLSKSLTI